MRCWEIMGSNVKRAVDSLNENANGEIMKRLLVSTWMYKKTKSIGGKIKNAKKFVKRSFPSCRLGHNTFFYHAT